MLKRLGADRGNTGEMSGTMIRIEPELRRPSHRGGGGMDPAG